MTLDLTDKKVKVNKKPKSMTLKELKQEKERLESLFIDPKVIETEYWRKITWSFSPLFFILLGFPLAVITNRREKSANVVLAILFAVGYYLISLGFENLCIEGILEPTYLMWIPNLIAAVLALFLYIKCVS